jgi:hypothetical protein
MGTLAASFRLNQPAGSARTLKATLLRGQQQRECRVLLVLDVIDRIHHHQQPGGLVHCPVLEMECAGGRPGGKLCRRNAPPSVRNVTQVA